MTELTTRTPASLSLGPIGNGSTSALVAPDGTIVWWCMPRFDGDPIFYSLVDSPDGYPEDGSFRIELRNFQRSEQEYVRNTAVLRTRLYSDEGAIEITDFMPRYMDNGRMFRTPQLVRRVRRLSGRPSIRVVARPRFGWGSQQPEVTEWSNHLRFVGAGSLRLTTNAPVSYVAAESWFLLDEPYSFIMGPDEPVSGDIDETARIMEMETVRYWKEWVKGLRVPLEWQRWVIRAAITLQLCTFDTTGAIVAAMTTSIPEAPNTERNWDYRACWPRDALFVVRALSGLGEVATLEKYLRWIRNVVATAENGHIQPLYGIGREGVLTESIVPNLRGYRGMGPVRRGNDAWTHTQLDVFGEIVLASTQWFFDQRFEEPGTRADFEQLEVVGERAWEVHTQPDASLWEYRDREEIHTSSVLMCWAACDRLAKIAAHLGLHDRARFWRERADIIDAKIEAEAWNEERQAYVDCFGGEYLDASVLLMAEVGYRPATHPRFVATVDAIKATLCNEAGFVKRYERPDDFGPPEVSFNVCTFWLIDALARIPGREDEAREIFDALLDKCNPLDLLSEDTHPVTGELWGNFPQTYSLVGIILCAMRLSKWWSTLV